MPPHSSSTEAILVLNEIAESSNNIKFKFIPSFSIYCLTGTSLEKKKIFGLTHLINVFEYYRILIKTLFGIKTSQA